MSRFCVLSLLLVGVVSLSAHAQVVTTTFETPPLATDSFLNDAAPNGYFDYDGNQFKNEFNADWGVWSGWAISTMTDTTTAGFTNQYSAITGSGAGGSKTYAMGFPSSATTPDLFHPQDSIINLKPGTQAVSVAVTNSTYAYLSMLNGDRFAHKFAAGDFLKLDVQGYAGLDGAGPLLGQVDFYLANFLNGNTLIVNTWEVIDLSSLAGASSLRFGITSSDNDPLYGVNTPSYFAIDNFQVQTVPEPGSLALLTIAALATSSFAAWRRVRRPSRRVADAA